MARIELGFPFAGFKDSKPRMDVPASKLTGDSDASSHDWDLLPDSQAEGEEEHARWIRRRGMTQHTNGLTEAGILYKDGSPLGPGFVRTKGWQVSEMRSPALDVAKPVTWAALIADEEHGSFTYGQLIWYEAQAATLRRVAYGGAWTAGAVPSNVIVWPWLGGNRMRDAGERFQHAGGSRNFVDVGGWIYLPSYGGEIGAAADGVPQRWNKQYPGSPYIPTRKEVVQPTGLLPPAWMPRITVAASSGVSLTGIPWAGQDLFYVSMAYVYDDGSIGPVLTPRPPNTELASAVMVNDMSPVNVGGYGLIQLSSTGTDSFPVITWSGICTPPTGVAGVALLRSPKVDGTIANNLPDPTDLRIVTILKAGQTTYVDAMGNDRGIAVDVRLTEPLTAPARAHVLPPRARYIGRFDGRLAVSYVRGNTLGIQIQLRATSTGTSDEFNTDEASIYTDREAYVSIVGTTLNLYVRGNVTVVNGLHRRQYALTGVTLQKLVDLINSQRGVAADTNTAYRWHAALLPGADGSALATLLADAAASVAFGDRSFVAAASALLDGSATLAGAPTIDAMRCVASSWPGILRYSLPNNNAQGDLHYFTRGGPDVPINAAMAFCLGNNRRNPANTGLAAGPILPLIKGGLVPCTRAVCWIGAQTSDVDPIGTDDSVDLKVIDAERGVISPNGAAGHGFAVVLTTQGIYAYDHLGRTLNISEDLYDPATGTGSLAYEITQCIAATGLDDSSGYFNCLIAENQIAISFRSSVVVAGNGTAGTRPDRKLVADFSPGIERSGVAALINPKTGRFWGWGCPQIAADTIQENTGGATKLSKIMPGAMGVVRNTDGTLSWFGIRDKHDNNNGAGSTDGRMEQFNTSTTDNGTAIAPDGYSATLVTPTGVSMKADKARIVYRKNGAGLTLAHARTKNAHANAGYFRSKALATSGTDKFSDYLWRLPTAARGPTDACTFRISDDGTTTDRPEVWGILFDYKEVDLGV